MNFGQAMEAVKNGKLIRRTSWVPDHFVFMQIPSRIPADVVPKMQSVPDVAKAVFKRRFENETEQIDAIHYVDQLAYVGFSSTISGWSPIANDCLADNWELYE